jgi:DNA-directed RNA polymerase specialized sigma24 family protein
MEKAGFEKEKKHNEPDWSGLHLTLFRYCFSIAGVKEKAEDLAQSTWLKAIPVLKEKGHANPEAFLLRIAKNKWIDQCRKQRLMLQKSVGLAHETASDEIAAVEIEPLLQAMSDRMSPMQLGVFLLREVLSYSISDTALILETTEGAVKSAHFRARNAVSHIREDLLRDEKELEAQAEYKQGGMDSKQHTPEQESLWGNSRYSRADKDWLNRLAWACLEGDGPALVDLVVGLGTDTTALARRLQTKTKRRPSTSSFGGITMMMAA